MRILLMLICLGFAIFTMGMTFAPTQAEISYNQLKIGDSYDTMVEYFGKPRYSEPDYQWGQKITYYVYKHGNKIGINDDTGKVVDINIVDDSYERHESLKMGTTQYKVESTFGNADRQFIEGKICYAYKNADDIRIILQIESTDRYLEAVRITSLPIELPEDHTAYLPDDATDENENPMIADKQIDTSSITPDKPADKFKINYNYSLTK